MQTNKKMIPPGVAIEIELIRSDPAFTIMSPEHDGYQLWITDACLSVRRSRIEQETHDRLFKKLKTQPAIFPYKTIKPHVFHVAKGASAVSVMPFWKSLPKRAFMFFIRTSAINPGKAPENPRIFRNLNIRQVKFLVDGRLFGRAIETDFKNRMAASAYMSMLLMLERGNDMFRPPSYDFDDYINQFTVWAVDLTTDDYASRAPAGQLSVDIDFSDETPTENITGFLCGEGSAVVTISGGLEVEDLSSL